MESYAANVGWQLCPCNVIVEGTSDVVLFWFAAALYFERHQSPILGHQIAILPAGKGNEGGVDGVNRRLTAARQIADVDRDATGALRHRFIGLFDNDRAGRRAVDNACNFDRRLLRYGDLFLLHPIMPLSLAPDHASLRRRIEIENEPYKGLDWEIEDLLSDRLLSLFEKHHAQAVERVQEIGGRKHRDFSRDGKQRLHDFVKINATMDDLSEIVKLLCALRGYMHVPFDHIKF